jgi:hypothetical protein
MSTDKKIKLPKQLHITAKYEGYWDREKDEYIRFESPYPLGFRQDYEPHLRTWEKKLKTQMEWAYGGNDLWYNRHEIVDGVVIQITGENKLRDPLDYRKGYDQILTRAPARFQPTIWDNVPMEGFRVMKSVSRSSTSNKVWRILDPRGVQFEISTAAMEDLLETTTIEKNLIHGHCIWAGKTVLRFLE